jgi:hypothetical protein
MGSVIFQAGQRRVMAEGSLLMIHDPISLMWGNAAEMRKEAKVLDTHKETLMSIYLNAGFADGNKERLSSMMSRETWLKGEDAIAAGLADRIEGEVKAAACLPTDFVNRAYAAAPKIELMPFLADPTENRCEPNPLEELQELERCLINRSRITNI